MQIPTLSAKTDVSEMTDTLQQYGCLVVADVTSAEMRDTVRRELEPAMVNAKVIQDDDPTQFYPGLTRRASGLVAHSEAVGDLILHDQSKSLCERVLTPNSDYGYQLHVTAALEVGPGARRQVLHREDDSFTFFAQPKPNIILASMWAVSDFRRDNGATLVVPGSHLWPEERQATEDEICVAEMSAGSVLYWLGSTLHGAGANVSNEWRYGVILTYSLGWVRQEENQYLSVPPEIARTLRSELRDLIGYKMYRALGFSTNKSVGEIPA